MQIFLFLNDFARKWPLLDEAARFFFVAGAPLLATLLLAQLTVFWPRESALSRTKIALAVLVAVGFGAALMLLIEAISQNFGLGALSQRPFMTRRVNLLVLEPQNNSFPSPEIVLAGIFCFASLLISWRVGIFAAFGALLLAATRMFCGTNYFADVAFGLAFGVAFGALAFSLFRVGQTSQIRARQTGFSLASLGALGVLLFVFASGEARFAGKLAAPWNAPAHAQNGYASEAAVLSDNDAASEAKKMALSKRGSLYLPEVELFLRGKLGPLARPFSLLDVEVAPLRTRDFSFRAASIRFEISRETPDLRRKTADVAAKLVRAAFAHDSQLQNVDVTAILRGKAREIDGSLVRHVGDEVPVFTASIQRKNLNIKNNAWANSPQIDGGSWLRFRSRLYINARILPDTAPKNEPKAPVLTSRLEMKTEGSNLPIVSGEPPPAPPWKGGETNSQLSGVSREGRGSSTPILSNEGPGKIP